MKRISRLLMMFLIVIMCLAPMTAVASPISDEELISSHEFDNFVITSYDVKIDVSEDNVYSISENITAYFNRAKHGITRSIPTSFSLNRTDGSSTKMRANVQNISVSDNFTKSSEDGDLILQIGDADKTITGYHTYNIRYDYNMGRDRLKNADELYFNIIGTEWDAAINNVTFTINMPKDFDTSKLGFASGNYGNDYTNNILYTVNGTAITGSFENVLEKNQGLTVRCELPDGYFTYDYMQYIKQAVIVALPMLVVMVAVFILWVLYGRDKHVVETVEFYPPEGMNSAELALWYRGKVKKEDVVSLLIYLADKGYISIEETEKKYAAKGYKITKLHEYEGDNETERLFMQGLFKNGRTKVSDTQLEDKFYTTIDKIVTLLNSKSSRSLVYSKTSLTMRTLSIFMTIAGFVLSLVLYSRASGYGMAVLPILLPMAIIITVIVSMASQKKMSIFAFGFLFIWCSALFPMMTTFFDCDPIYLIGIVVSLVLGAICAILCKIMVQRTKEGYENLGKIRGFKNFLEKAEKERLEAMVNENPTYFYNILPYTYVLGVSEKWMKKFENIAMEAPSWYTTPGTGRMLDYYVFSSFMNSTMSRANTVMNSAPAATSSGGSGGGGGFSGGGGGFSGGGGGGGGGGSW